MYRNIALTTSILIYLSNLTLLPINSWIPYIGIITFLFGTEITAYIFYLKNTKIIKNDLDSLISDIMESYRLSRNSSHNKNKKVCGECRKDKNEGYTHCYECQVCILNRDHHCIWLDSCISDSNTYFYHAILLLQFVLCCNGMLRSYGLVSGDSIPLKIWGLLVFGLNLCVSLILGSVMVNNLVRMSLRRKKEKGKSMRGDLIELEQKIGHGFTRVTVL